MRKPSIHILFAMREGPWGGGNQFLKALKGAFVEKGVYEEDSRRADIILFNSNPSNCRDMLGECYVLRKRYRKTVINRLDGPVQLVRGRDSSVDRAIYHFNSRFCDGTIYQSKWSRERNLEMGLRQTGLDTVILNAPDPRWFYPAPRKRTPTGKIRLIATSWSPNMRKGFDIYRFLDKRLDFSKYDMRFFGNSPISFRNIEVREPVSSEVLGERLRESDVFITASINDPCSNSLIEAMHCGLPAVARNSGGHPEIVGNAGRMFEGEGDVIDAIETVAAGAEQYRDKITLPAIEEVAEKYYEFCVEAQNAANDKGKAGYLDFFWIKYLVNRERRQGIRMW